MNALRVGDSLDAPRFSVSAAATRVSEIDGLFRQVATRLQPYISAGQPIPDSVWAEHDTLLAQATAIGGGDLEGFFRSEVLRSEQEIARATGGEYWHIGNAPPYPVLYAAAVMRPSGLFYLRGETGPFGHYTLFIPRDGALLDVSFYDPRTQRYGTVFPILSPNSRYKVPRLLLSTIPQGSADLDRDGLADFVELVYGTDWNKADSDNDGINDGAEVAQGTNPLDGLGVRTGVIAAVDTAGTAVDFAIQHNLAVVADSSRGVAIFDLSRGLTPTLAAVVDTPGAARAVARSDNWAAVADETSGLAIIDLTSPTGARLSRQVEVSGNVQAVAAAGAIAFAGVSTGLVVAVDLASSAVLKSVRAGDEVHDLQIEGDTLYVLLDEEIRAYSVLPTPLEFLGSVATSDIGADSFADRKRLFVGGGIAYVSVLSGFETFDVRNPISMQPLGALRATGPRSFKQIVSDGFGFGVGAVGINSSSEGMHDVWLYDVLNPALTDKFLTTVPTPGVARAVAIHNGLAYIADGDAGLQVVNYRESDRSTNAPTISLTSNFAPGKAEEGKTMRITANVRDDVQVRNVEFYLDDRLIHADGSFPFEHYFQAPRTNAQQTSFRLKARATDTAGNSTWTSDMLFNLVPDATPPRVVTVAPGPGLFFAPDDEVIAYFSEPLNPATLNNATFQIISAGPDGTLGTGDDLPVSAQAVSFRPETNAAVLSFATDLPPGQYRAVLSTGITDVAGNPVGAEFFWSFVSAARIAFGETIQGSIIFAGEKDYYTFDATAGDRIRIRLTESGPITPFLELFDSDGKKLADNYTFSSEALLERILDQGGTYFFSVSDQERKGTANYGVFLQRLKGPAGANPLTFGQVAAGAIAGLAETDSYAFQAAAGDRIRLRMTEPGPLSPQVELFDAQGGKLGEDSSFSSEAVLDYQMLTGGTFFVLLSDYSGTATGSYGIFLQRLTGAAGAVPIAFGQTLTNAIETLAEADSYTFQAAVGDRIRVRMAEPGPLSPQVELFNPQGEKVSEDSSFSSEALVDYLVTSAGTFLIVASDYSGTATGGYGIFLQRLTNPIDSKPLEFGQAATASIATLAEMDAFTFQAAAGERIRVRMTEPGPLSPQLEIFNSAGQKVGEDSSFSSEAEVDYSVPAAGTFVVLVSDYSGAATGAYGVFLQRLSTARTATSIAFGQTTNSSLTSLAESDAYTFQAAVGERIRVRMTEPGPLSPEVEIFDSRGEKVGEDSSFSSEALVDYRAQSGGSFLVVVSDYAGTATGAYSLHLQRLDAPAGARPLEIAQPLTASIDNLAETDAYIVQATAGQMLRIRMTEPGPLSPALELFNQQGEPLAQRSSFSSEALLEYLPTTTGPLFLLASDYDGTRTGTYNLIIEP
jgi:hypothetical protein